MTDVVTRQCANQLVHAAHAWPDILEDGQACYCNGVAAGIFPCDEARIVPGDPPTFEPMPARQRAPFATLATDEPIFTIRAQDILAPQALAAYAALARKLDLHDHAQRVEAIAVDFLAWQAAHAKRVKRPD